MSGETTNPNGSRREVNVKNNADDVTAAMIKAGYAVEVEALEFRPSDRELTITEMASYKDSETGNGNNTESGTTNAPHIVDGTIASVSFIQKIPAIAQGPVAPLKGKRKQKGENAKVSDRKKGDSKTSENEKSSNSNINELDK